MDKIERENIYAGLLCKNIGFLSCEIVRGIIFRVDGEEAIDILNNISYKIASLKELCVPRGMTVSLGKTLKNLGYPDIMTEENVYNLLNIDFGRLMRISGVYNTFPFFEEHQYFSDDELTRLHLGFSITPGEKGMTKVKRYSDNKKK